MNKREFISVVSENLDMTKKDVAAVVNETLFQITAALSNGEKVHFSGFGSFQSRVKDARTARNPKTGEEVEVPACVVPVFKAGRIMKDRLSSEQLR